MARGSESRRKELGGQDEGGGVGPEVRGEEGERVEHHVPGVRGVAAPVAVVRSGEREEEDGHEEEPGHLEPASAHAVDEEHGHEVARDGGRNGDDGLELGHVEGLLERVHVLSRREPRSVDLGLEQRAAVVGDVDKEPRRRARQEVPAVPPEEAAREEAVRRRRREAELRRGSRAAEGGHLLLGVRGQVEVAEHAADVVGCLHHVVLHKRRKPAVIVKVYHVKLV